MSFEHIKVKIEFVIKGDIFNDKSVITSFKHYRTDQELQWADVYINGLVEDFFGSHVDEMEAPTIEGHFQLIGEWNEDLEIVEEVYSLEKVRII